jgi:hypothetical protein
MPFREPSVYSKPNSHINQIKTKAQRNDKFDQTVHHWIFTNHIALLQRFSPRHLPIHCEHPRYHGSQVCSQLSSDALLLPLLVLYSDSINQPPFSLATWF